MEMSCGFVGLDVTVVACFMVISTFLLDRVEMHPYGFPNDLAFVY